jgi:hypothetical protein
LPKVQFPVSPKRAASFRSDTIDLDFAPPSVSRVDVNRTIGDDPAAVIEYPSNVREAPTIEIEKPGSEVVGLPQVPPDTASGSEISMPTEAETVKTAPAPDMAGSDVPKPAQEPTRPESEAAASVGGPESPVATPRDQAAVAPPEGTPERGIRKRSTPEQDRTAVASVPLGDPIRPGADDGDGQCLSFQPLAASANAKAARSEPQPPGSPSTIHATRLREIARESLRHCYHRLQRGATHSAKKFALDALRSVVAMRDAQSGGNENALYLERAFDAVRESEDFSGRFGIVDPNALQRMVAVHETTVLKEHEDLESLSALEAIEAYLAEAKRNFVHAAEGSREGSDALMLLGKIETRLASENSIHAAAVAVTLQRAAVEIEPRNAIGYRELGATLLAQGLADQAAWALHRSLEIDPTRTGFQRLLEASRRLGDIDTARMCLASLKNPRLKSEIPVRPLSPKAFAATHRPDPASMKPVAARPENTANPAQKTDQPRIGFRSFFPFGRK